jgi:hypothetical protein
MAYSDFTDKERLNKRWHALKSERSSWEALWQDINDILLPRSARFFVEDRNRGDKRPSRILDNSAMRAHDTLSAGLMAGMTSPARPWFRLTTNQPDLDESHEVKRWLEDVARIMRMIFAHSNTYRALHTYYEELGAFGTAAAIVLPDFDSVIHHYPSPCGEYAIATDSRGYVDTLGREFQMTVGQMVERFGLKNCSVSVRNMFDHHDLDNWVTVHHIVEPRKARDASKRDSLNMPYRSVYFENGGDDAMLLEDSGFRTFRVLAPRWKVTGGDIYGESPALRALGDIMQLQQEQIRKGQGIDFQSMPPLQAPTSMRSHVIDMLPGGVSYVDSATAQAGVRPMWEVRLDLGNLLLDIKDVRERINSAFYADLFLMLQMADKNGLTATEVTVRQEEKLLMIGPVLERLHNELLNDLVEMTFDQMLRAGIVPPPPQEMNNMELNVEFVSMLAQAQRAISTNTIDRFVANLGMIAQMKPDVLDKFNSDHWVDSYADMTGVDPEMIVPGKEVALIRQQRAEANQAMQQAAMLQQGADVAAKLGSVDTSRPNALTDATRAFSGYT